MRLTPEVIVRAYAQGAFPMAESAASTEVRWFEPQRRGLLPLADFRVSRSTRKTRRQGAFSFSCDEDFAAVMRACANRDETWINDEIFAVFSQLHAQGLAHAVAVHGPDGTFAGGVYGLALGAAFFAESMVSGVTGGSKMALAELVARLRRGGFRLLDTQYLTPHLASLGGIEVPRAAYRRLLAEALAAPADPARAFARRNRERTDGAYWPG